MSTLDSNDSVIDAFSKLLNASDRTRILREFNATAAPLPAEQLIHSIFEARVTENPGAPAVIDNDCRLTFEQLNGRANQLAHVLHRLGVGADERVCLYVERSVDTVIGMLGILKAGAAYVPLDPADPIARLEAIVDESDPVLVLTQRQLLEAATSLHRYVMVLGDESGEGTHNLSLPGLHPRSLAYVMHTSCSTGRPRGVMIEHRGVIRLALNTSSASIGHGDCVVHSSSPAFDASSWEIWAPLLNGGRILIVRQSTLADPVALNETLVRNDATALWLMAGFFNENIDALEQAFGRLSYLIIGGDIVNPSFARRALLKPNPPRHLINGYGPTETTTFATTYAIRSIDETTTSIPIGRPLDNTSIFIVNDRCEALPIGMVGEICIGGAGVARGYLHRPSLTAERFIPNPFSDDSSDRLYCTGDRGRWRRDGTIEFLGRQDSQVKMHGCRVELSEVEGVLRGCEGIRDAAVIAQEEELGEKQLVGYVVPDMPTLKAAARKSGDQALEVVDQWRSLYEETYANGGIEPSFVSWNSSYTGQPIPEEEMKEWLHHTVRRIRELSPRSALEIGCGVGLVLQHIAPECAVYFGTDISGEALRKLRAWLSTQTDLRHVQLKQASALDLDEMTPGNFDTIILNSVVQYFPDVSYLCAVLDKAVRLLAPGGHVFIGDVRNYSLLAVFHSSVELERAEPYVSAAQIRLRVARAIEQEKELAISPELFAEFARRNCEVGGVRMSLKRGKSVNELTSYRYDVVLEKSNVVHRAEPEIINWQIEWNAENVLRRVRESGVHVCSIQNIPNIRLSRDILAAELIEASERTRPAGNIRQILSKKPLRGEDPHMFEAIAEGYGYHAHIGWNCSSNAGHFDVELSDRGTGAAEPEIAALLFSSNGRAASASLYEQYANDPLGKRVRQQLPSALTEYLSAKLPSFMVPSAFAVLESLPISSNGKLDRGALPPIIFVRPTNADNEQPKGTTEELLARIWHEVLQAEQVGRNDNFFALGGHSMSAARLAARVGDRFGIRFQIQQVLRSPVLCDMAQSIEQLRLQAGVPLYHDQTIVEEGTI